MKLFASRKSKNEKDQPELRQRSKVYSYYSAKNQQINQTARNIETDSSKNKLAFFIKYWFYFLIGSVLALSFIYSLYLKPNASLTVVGTKYRTTAEYQQITDQILAENPIVLSKATIRVSKLEEKIKKEIPEASSVKISVPILGNRPDVEITTDSAMAIFSNSNASQYILSSKGRVLLPAEESIDSVKQLPKIINNTGVEIGQGEQFLNPSEAKALGMLIYQTGPAVTFEIPVQLQEVYLRDTAKGNYYTKFLLDPENINQQYGAYLAVVQKLAGNNPSEYIDARLADKVYVK
jgi:hypothetical protein